MMQERRKMNRRKEDRRKGDEGLALIVNLIKTYGVNCAIKAVNELSEELKK